MFAIMYSAQFPCRTTIKKNEINEQMNKQDIINTAYMFLNVLIYLFLY